MTTPQEDGCAEWCYVQVLWEEVLLALDRLPREELSAQDNWPGGSALQGVPTEV